MIFILIHVQDTYVIQFIECPMTSKHRGLLVWKGVNIDKSEFLIKAAIFTLVYYIILHSIINKLTNKQAHRDS